MYHWRRYVRITGRYFLWRSHFILVVPRGYPDIPVMMVTRYKRLLRQLGQYTAVATATYQYYVCAPHVASQLCAQKRKGSVLHKNSGTERPCNHTHPGPRRCSPPRRVVSHRQHESPSSVYLQLGPSPGRYPGPQQRRSCSLGPESSFNCRTWPLQNFLTSQAPAAPHRTIRLGT